MDPRTGRFVAAFVISLLIGTSACGSNEVHEEPSGGTPTTGAPVAPPSDPTGTTLDVPSSPRQADPGSSGKGSTGNEGS